MKNFHGTPNQTNPLDIRDADSVRLFNTWAKEAGLTIKRMCLIGTGVAVVQLDADVEWHVWFDADYWTSKAVLPPVVISKLGGTENLNAVEFLRVKMMPMKLQAPTPNDLETLRVLAFTARAHLEPTGATTQWYEQGRAILEREATKE